MRKEEDLELELEQANQPANFELEHVDLSDTTGLLDDQDEDWNDAPLRPRGRGADSGTRTFALLPQSAKITYGLFILLFIFILIIMLIVSYRLFFHKDTDPTPTPQPPTPPAPPARQLYTAFLRQTWLPTECLDRSCSKYSFASNLAFGIEEFRPILSSVADPQRLCSATPVAYEDVEKLNANVYNELKVYWPFTDNWKAEWENHGKCMPQNTSYSEIEYFKLALQVRKQIDFYSSVKEFFNTTLVANATVILKHNLLSAIAFKSPIDSAVTIQPLIKCEITGSVTLLHSIVTCVNQDYQFVPCPDSFKSANPDECGAATESIITVPPLSSLHVPQ